MKLILGSKSPRRQQLLQEMGYSFEIRVKETDESYPDNLPPHEVAQYISTNKAKVLQNELNEDEVLLTADTIVCVDGVILEKPKDEVEAINMLKQLSGKQHSVVTGVCIADKKKITSDYSETKVWVKDLSDTEILNYIRMYKPYDKAGSYGIQEWFGAVAIEKIEGSYNNVVGLPTHLIYKSLKHYSH
jgi:septum formation protein